MEADRPSVVVFVAVLLCFLGGRWGGGTEWAAGVASVGFLLLRLLLHCQLVGNQQSGLCQGVYGCVVSRVSFHAEVLPDLHATA